MRSSEKPLLNTFNKCLKINNKIGTTYNRNIKSHRVQFGNVQFYNWLLKIGLSPVTSRTIGKVDIPDKVFRDYLRGCIDGDGNIRTYKDTYNIYKGRRYATWRLFVRIVSASQKHIVWLQNKIKTLVGINGAVIKSVPSDQHRVPIWILQFAKKESVRLISWIYYKQNIPCLERKRETATRALTTISKKKRRKYTKII